jgi:hypothetical protein
MSSLLSGLLSFAIFGSFVWAAILFGVLLICLFTSEVKKEGSIAFGAVLAFILLNYFFGNIPLNGLVSWQNVTIYLLIGLFFTVVRVFFYGRAMASKGDKFDKYYLKGNVFRWWFIWPVSLLTWVLSDIIADVWSFVYEKMGKIFEYFMELGFNSVKKSK